MDCQVDSELDSTELPWFIRGLMVSKMMNENPRHERANYISRIMTERDSM